MVVRIKPPITKNLDEAMRKFPHFNKYMRQIVREMDEPEFVIKLERDMKKQKTPNVIYPVGDPLFIHIYKKEGIINYIVIEPQMDDELKKLNEKILEKMVSIANRFEVPDKVEDMAPVLTKIYDMVVVVDEKHQGENLLTKKIHLKKWDYDMVKYYLIRDRVGYGKLEPLFLDPYLEDIHCVGVGAISSIHKVFEMVRSNIVFSNDFELNKYMVETSERVERP